MLTRTQIAHLREYPGLGWISALRSTESRDLAEERRRKREVLLAATERDLARIAGAVRRRTAKPLDRTAIALKVGKVIQRYKMAKHFLLEFGDGEFRW